MPIKKGKKNTQTEIIKQCKANAVKEREENAKRIKFCKKHNRYHGSDCIDCILERPKTKEKS